MIQPFQYAYLGESLIRPTANVARFIAPSDGTISELFINAIFAPFKDTTFNLKINGVSKFSGAARPTISAGMNSVSKTGLSFAVVKGDVISFDAEIIRQGGVSAPVFFQVNFADEQEFTSEADVVALIGENIVAGDNVTIEENDGVLTINSTGVDNGASGFSFFNPDVPYASPSAFDDEFDGTSLDAKWTVRGTNTRTFENPFSYMKMVATLTTVNGIYQPFTSANGNAIFRAKITPYATAAGSQTFTGGIYVRNASNQAFGINLIKTNEYFNIGSPFWSGGLTYSSSQSSHSSLRIPSGQSVWLEIDINFTTTNIIYRYSLDGINFAFFYSQTSGATGCQEVGINGSSAAGGEIRVDWFRKLDGTGFTGKKIDL